MSDEGFTADERAAMKERAKEIRARKSGKKVDGPTDMAEKIAEMPEDSRRVAEKLRDIITDVAPDLEQKTWYSQPAWAKDGKVVVFFQSAAKFGTRYNTLGFSETAALDDGSMWPTSYALPDITAADEKKLREIIAKAVGA